MGEFIRSNFQQLGQALTVSHQGFAVGLAVALFSRTLVSLGSIVALALYVGPDANCHSHHWYQI